MAAVRRSDSSGRLPMRRTGNLPQDDFSDETKARLFLLLACIWPLVIMALFSASSPASSQEEFPQANPGKTIRNILDRVDILGYSPTHPRVAFCVVGQDAEKVKESVESIFRNTDRNRLFLVAVVMDGVKDDPGLVTKLKSIDDGSVPHWHGLSLHVHDEGPQKEDDQHSTKIQVFFNESPQGTAASRLQGATFLHLLAQKHETAGLKSPEEDLMLILLQEGAKLQDATWLKHVTAALIVPPPLVAVKDHAVAQKVANAVSFSTEGPAKRTCFDYSLAKHTCDTSATDMAVDNGNSYPTLSLAGAATALRLETFLNLPSQDASLQSAWAADLDLSLNLWLCADGIDILRNVLVDMDKTKQQEQSFVSSQEAARFAAAWMDEEHSKHVCDTFQGSPSQKEFNKLMKAAKKLTTFPSGLQHKCRSFDWLANQFTIEQGTAVVQMPKGTKPLKPLDEARLALVQKATPIDISYVDVSGGHKNHPHLGGKDESGSFGYKHDETALKNDPPPFEFERLQRACSNHDAHYKMLTEKVFVDLKAHEEAEASGRRRDKIFCVVYTIESGHPAIPAIRQTWGQKCDGFMVASNKTDRALGTVELPHEGKEKYNNIWQKVRSIWSYVYDNYYEDYDWFHIGGDDLYLIVENLRLYLESEEIRLAANGGLQLPLGTPQEQTPLFLGRRFAYMGKMDEIFNSGGSGYTMNKAALKALVVNGFPRYFPHFETFSEDTMVARIFQKMGVFPYDTKDETGGERYMPFLPGHHYQYRLPKDPSKDWYAKYSIDIKFGLDHCAARSVAFHYAKDNMMKRMHAILYHHCPQDD